MAILGGAHTGRSFSPSFSISCATFSSAIFSTLEPPPHRRRSGRHRIAAARAAAPPTLRSAPLRRCSAAARVGAAPAAALPPLESVLVGPPRPPLGSPLRHRSGRLALRSGHPARRSGILACRSPRPARLARWSPRSEHSIDLAVRI
ncbi:hypothetical protein GUJ93_ZPchr0006g45613 [Zizania palustris]|uniref:Uncharacterized protein n=1 Tax=Zizania palustris TaxID=103762 RepID=A0A8J5SW40_ZIZPA|nr:hypothetical protein GUJ93_ZPchr0006g45613 [Zizania palustris]